MVRFNNKMSKLLRRLIVMSTFEEKMEAMKGLSEEEMAERIKKVKAACICAGCPSYEGTGETELGFCALGKSSVIKEEKGCTCGSCPVTEMMSLRWLYYCTRGAARELAVAEKK